MVTFPGFNSIQLSLSLKKMKRGQTTSCHTFFHPVLVCFEGGGGLALWSKFLPELAEFVQDLRNVMFFTWCLSFILVFIWLYVLSPDCIIFGILNNFALMISVNALSNPPPPETHNAHLNQSKNDFKLFWGVSANLVAATICQIDPQFIHMYPIH